MITEILGIACLALFVAVVALMFLVSLMSKAPYGE